MEPEAKRYRSDDGNGNFQKNNIVDNVEKIMISLLSFLGDHDKRSYTAIKDEFLPKVISESRTFNFGEKAYLINFPKLNKSQKKIVRHIFKNARTLHVSDQIEKHKLLKYARKFKKLSRLIIEVDQSDNFTSKYEADLSQLELKFHNETHRHDIVRQILQQTPFLKCLKIHHGEFTLQSIIKLDMMALTSIKLINVHLKREYKHLLQQYLRRHDLVNIAVVTSNHNCPAFREISHELPIMFRSKNNNIQNLKFTVEQNREQNFDNLRNLERLKGLTIYYSSRCKTENVKKLCTVLNELQIERIKFIEYSYTDKKQIQTKDYIDVLIELSDAYAKLLGETCPRASIVSYKDHQKNAAKDLNY